MSRRLTRAPQLLTAILVVGVWEILAVTTRPKWLPTVESVVSSWWQLVESGAFRVVTGTLVTLGIGLAVVFVVAAIISSLLAWSRLLDEAITPLLNAIMATPSIALIPIYIFIFGLGNTTRVVTIIGFALLPVTLDWITALKEVPRQLLEMSSSFGASRRAKVLTILLPSAAPLLLTGLRIGVVQAIKGVVAAEIIIGVVGIGQLLVEASLTYDIPQLYAVVLTILAASIVSYLIVNFWERRTSRWADPT